MLGETHCQAHNVSAREEEEVESNKKRYFKPNGVKLYFEKLQHVSIAHMTYNRTPQNAFSASFMEVE